MTDQHQFNRLAPLRNVRHWHIVPSPVMVTVKMSCGHSLTLPFKRMRHSAEKRGPRPARKWIGFVTGKFAPDKMRCWKCKGGHEL